jgi:hypothetical protein
MEVWESCQWTWQATLEANVKLRKRGCEKAVESLKQASEQESSGLWGNMAKGMMERSQNPEAYGGCPAPLKPPYLCLPRALPLPVELGRTEWADSSLALTRKEGWGRLWKAPGQVVRREDSCVEILHVTSTCCQVTFSTNLGFSVRIKTKFLASILADTFYIPSYCTILLRKPSHLDFLRYLDSTKRTTLGKNLAILPISERKEKSLLRVLGNCAHFFQ